MSKYTVRHIYIVLIMQNNTTRKEDTITASIWMIKNFQNNSFLMNSRMEFTFSTMNRIGDKTETTQ